MHAVIKVVYTCFDTTVKKSCLVSQGGLVSIASVFHVYD